MNTAKKTQELKINYNQVTDMTWSANHNYVFYQTSKDLRFRIFDTRDPLNVTITTKIDDSYATSMDVDDTGYYLTTGHNGFNNNNGNVKLWDLRKISDQFEPVFVFNHDQAIVSARFYYMPRRAFQNKFIVSASSDETIKLTDVNGNPENEESGSVFESDEAFTSMGPLRSRQNASRTGMNTDRYIIAGTEKPQINMFDIDDITLEIIEYKSTNPTAVIMD